MGKRPTETRPSHSGDGAKRRKLDGSTGGLTAPQQVHSARHLQQLLSFQQDSGFELKHGAVPDSNPSS